MSKSLGNVIAPAEIIDQYGADILRLWVASSDYHSDVRISTDILKQLSEVYRKIRNTARYILGNLYDFNPDTDSVSDDQLTELDRWALDRSELPAEKVREAYDGLSSTLFIMRSTTSARWICPASIWMCSKTASMRRPPIRWSVGRPDRHLSHPAGVDLAARADDPLHCGGDLVLSSLGEGHGQNRAGLQRDAHRPRRWSEAFMAKWDRIHAVRDDVNKALELARTAKVIGKSLEAKVILPCEGELLDFVGSVKETLPMVFIVSQVEIKEGAEGDFAGDVAGLKVTVAKADGQKCERCWIYSDTVGQCAEHPTLCARCAKVLGK